MFSAPLKCLYNRVKNRRDKREGGNRRDGSPVSASTQNSFPQRRGEDLSPALRLARLHRIAYSQLEQPEPEARAYDPPPFALQPSVSSSPPPPPPLCLCIPIVSDISHFSCVSPSAFLISIFGVFLFKFLRSPIRRFSLCHFITFCATFLRIYEGFAQFITLIQTFQWLSRGIYGSVFWNA